jgi:hypothetical protein
VLFPGASVAVSDKDTERSTTQRTATPSAFPLTLVLVGLALIIGWVLIRTVVED